MRALLYLLVLVNAACLRKTEFNCSDDASCGAGGRCESTGFCSFVDPGCASGRVYDSSAGSYAGECTSGGQPNPDGGIDARITDGSMTDTPLPAGCPGTYQPLPGVPGHLYRVITAGDDWSKQHAACRLNSTAAYLAVPDTIEELTALDTLAGSPNYWVGISDTGTEMTWLNVLDQAQTFLPWQPPAPDNAGGGQGEDCVEALSATHTINDRRCMDNLPAVCECNP